MGKPVTELTSRPEMRPCVVCAPAVTLTSIKMNSLKRKAILPALQLAFSLAEAFPREGSTLASRGPFGSCFRLYYRAFPIHAPGGWTPSTRPKLEEGSGYQVKA